MIKLKAIFFLFFFSIISQSESSLTIENIKMDQSGITSNILFKNLSNYYFLYAYKEGNNTFISDFDYNPKLKTAGFSLSIKDSTGKNLISGMSIPFGLSLKDLKKMDKMQKKEKLKKIFLKEKSSFTALVKMPNSIGIESLKNQLRFQKLLEKKSKLYITIIYNQDSTYVRNCLSKKILDSLSKNNIKIFHGALTSNTITIDNNR